jgi:hypothetical protein
MVFRGLIIWALCMYVFFMTYISISMYIHIHSSWHMCIVIFLFFFHPFYISTRLAKAQANFVWYWIDRSWLMVRAAQEKPIEVASHIYGEHVLIGEIYHYTSRQIPILNEVSSYTKTVLCWCKNIFLESWCLCDIWKSYVKWLRSPFLSDQIVWLTGTTQRWGWQQSSNRGWQQSSNRGWQQSSNIFSVPHRGQLRQEVKLDVLGHASCCHHTVIREK